MGGLVFRSNNTNMSFKDPIYTNGKNFGTHHLCLRTGTGDNAVIKYGLTSNRTASIYCPMKLRVDGKDAYIGKASTTNTYREVKSSYTSRRVDVTYSSTSSASGTYTYPVTTQYYAQGNTYTYPVTTQYWVDGGTYTYQVTWASSTTVMGPGPEVLTTGYNTYTVMSGHKSTTYMKETTTTQWLQSTNGQNYVGAVRTFVQGMTQVDIILTKSSTYTYHDHPMTVGTVTGVASSAATSQGQGGYMYETYTRTSQGAGGWYTTTYRTTASDYSSGTYSNISYTYKEDGYNTWYETNTSTTPTNINM